MTEIITSIVKTVLFVMAALLPIMNPPGNAPVVLALTAGASEQVRALIARRIARNVFSLLLAAMLVGSYVLAFFGISLPVVKVAGGLLVISTGWGLLATEDPSPTTQAMPSGSSPWSPDRVAQKAFYPLTFPLTVGPGSISVSLTLGAGLHEQGHEIIVPLIASIIGLALAAGVVYLSYRYAGRLIHALGTTGTIVLLRLSAFILICIGVQLVWGGLSELLQPWQPVRVQQ
jgi:multiple antibiotic resistance protein